MAKEKAVLKSGESHRRNGVIEEQEQRKTKRRKLTWGYSTAERAKSERTVNRAGWYLVIS
jgi:hypothetical protein